MKKHPIDIRHHNRLKAMTLAVSLAALSFSVGVQARGLTHPVDPDYDGSVDMTGVAYPGDTVEVTGSDFKPGQEVQLLSDGSPITTEAILRVNEEGEFTAQVPIPPESPVGIHPVVVQVVNPGAADIFDFKISPRIPFAGVDDYQIGRAPLNRGLYQGSYSAKSNAIYVTSAVGRPPVKESTLMKVNPQTLAIEKQITPAADPTGKQLEAVYGIAIDDEAGTVWVGNTRTGAVAVYKQDDLSLVKQFEDKISPHNREVAVDGKRHRAYVAAHGKSFVNVFDTQALKETTQIELESPTRLPEPPKAMGFAIDHANGRLFVVSSSNQIYVIDQDTDKIDKVFDLKGAENSTAVAYAPEEQLLFVASQDSDNLQILDANDGSLKADVKVGAGPLSVVWEPVRKLAYVASRDSDSLAVVDASGKLVSNLPAGSYANHVFTDGKGTIYGVNKSRGETDQEGDHISRYMVK